MQLQPNVLPLIPIAGQQTWSPLDVSGVVYDPAKIATMPPSLAETEGYRENNTAEHGWEIERHFQCQWSHVALAMQWFLGGSYLTLEQQGQAGPPQGVIQPDATIINNQNPPPGGGTIINTPANYISRVTPAQDPYRPALYAVSCELLEGKGAVLPDPGLFLVDADGVAVLPPGANLPDGQPGFILPGLVYAEQVAGPNPMPEEFKGVVPYGSFSDGMAHLRVKYRSLPYSVYNDKDTRDAGKGELLRYVEREPDFAIQGLPLNSVKGTGSLLTFYEGPAGIKGVQVPEAGVLLMPTASWRYVWHDVPFFPRTAILNCMGRVNAAPFDGVAGWPTFAPGTLLCQAPRIRRRRNMFLGTTFDIEWRLDERSPAGWNLFPAGDGNFYGASWGGAAPDASGSNLVFKEVDFNDPAIGLFHVEPANVWG